MAPLSVSPTPSAESVLPVVAAGRDVAPSTDRAAPDVDGTQAPKKFNVSMTQSSKRDVLSTVCDFQVKILVWLCGFEHKNKQKPGSVKSVPGATNRRL